MNGCYWHSRVAQLHSLRDKRKILMPISSIGFVTPITPIYAFLWDIHVKVSTSHRLRSGPFYFSSIKPIYLSWAENEENLMFYFVAEPYLDFSSVHPIFGISWATTASFVIIIIMKRLERSTEGQRHLRLTCTRVRPAVPESILDLRIFSFLLAFELLAFPSCTV